MIVHLGVIVIAVALAASNSYTRSATLALEAGVPVRVGRAHVRAARQCARRRDERVRALDGRRASSMATRAARRRSPATSRSAWTYPPRASTAGIVNDLYMTLEPGAVRRRQRGDDPRLRQAADPVDVAGRGDHGGRHAARRLPGLADDAARPTPCRRPFRIWASIVPDSGTCRHPDRRMTPRTPRSGSPSMSEARRVGGRGPVRGDGRRPRVRRAVLRARRCRHRRRRRPPTPRCSTGRRPTPSARRATGRRSTSPGARAAGSCSTSSTPSACRASRSTPSCSQFDAQRAPARQRRCRARHRRVPRRP